MKALSITNMSGAQRKPTITCLLHMASEMVREIAGSIPGRIIPNTLKMVLIAALLDAQGFGVSITTDWLVSG